MTVNCENRFVRLSHVPESHLFVISNWSEDIFLLLVPAYILYDAFMLFEFADRLDMLWSKHAFLTDIPYEDGGIICTWEQEAFLFLVPTKPVSFLLMSRQFELGLHFIRLWSSWMLEVVEDVDLTWDGLGSDDVSLLGHGSCSVDFSVVVDLRLYLDPLPLSSKSMSVCIVVMVLCRFDGCVFKRNLYFHDLKVVLLVLWGMRPNQKLLYRAIRVWRAKDEHMAYIFLSGNHSTVSDGHVRQWE